MGDEPRAGKGRYTAVYSRERDGAWIVYIRGNRHEIHTFARSLRRARENIRDALSLWYDDAESATIVDRVELEPALEEELAATEELARLHSDVSRKLAAKRRRAVRVVTMLAKPVWHRPSLSSPAWGLPRSNATMKRELS